jgi:hypothetical protein
VRDRLFQKPAYLKVSDRVHPGKFLVPIWGSTGKKIWFSGESFLPAAFF